MENQLRPLEEIVKELPPDFQQEVREYVEFLLYKREQKSGKKLRQNWAGASSDFKDDYTLLDLQKKALGWRGD